MNRHPSLSVRQPYADLIMRGVKDIENRSQSWQLRGRVLIHASATFGPDERAAAARYGKQLGVKRGAVYAPSLGVLLGTVEIVDAVDDHESEWFEGPVGYVLAKPKPFATPIAYKGAVGIFYVPSDLLPDATNAANEAAATKLARRGAAQAASGAPRDSRELPRPSPRPPTSRSSAPGGSASIPAMSNGEGSGTATVAVGSGPPVALRVDGPCLAGTLKALGGGSKPMSDASLSKIRSDALDLLGRVVAVYETNIGTGEVGAKGSSISSSKIPSVPSTGLLYGRIQSGKTVAMIALVAAAIDNGFRVVVVLTSDNVKLVSQTTERFSVLEGPMALDALNPAVWANDYKHIGKHLGQAGLVFVCSKNKVRLDNLIEFLESISAPNYPALILDDEADQATLDANVARRSRSRDKGSDEEINPTAIYSQVVDGLRHSLRHHVFLQVTATPYALLLQSVGEQLRPSFMRLLEPGPDYTGGEYFFENEQVEEQRPPLVFVAAEESEAILAGTTNTPEGLRKAIAFFLVAAAAQAINDPETAKAGQNFLCHTSQLRAQHKNLETLVRSYLDRVGDDVTAGVGEGFNRLQVAYEELGKTMPERPPFAAIADMARRKLVLRKVVVVNGDNEAETGRGFNFIIGGNILGRGVTIENLLVTYYLRQPKTGQMDTMLQHARMYGYRKKLMHLTRVFLPQQLAIRFNEIHGIERRLRRQLVTADMWKPIVIEKGTNLGPTRRTVLDPTYIDAFDPEEQIYPKFPEIEMKAARYTKISEKAHRLYGDLRNTKKPEVDPVVISYEEFYGLIDDFPYDAKQDSSSWIPSVLRRVIERQRQRCKDIAYLYVRQMQRRSTMFATGALSGKELDHLRRMDGPVFCLFRDDGSKIPNVKANPFWYPTIVLDQGTPSMVVNITPDEH